MVTLQPCTVLVPPSSHLHRSSPCKVGGASRSPPSLTNPESQKSPETRTQGPPEDAQLKQNHQLMLNSQYGRIPLAGKSPLTSNSPIMLNSPRSPGELEPRESFTHELAKMANYQTAQPQDGEITQGLKARET